MKHLLLVFLLCSPFSLFAQEITGKWYAYTNMKRVKLRLVYDIQKDKDQYRATLQIPDQSEEIYPSAIKYENRTLLISTPAAGITCEGRLQEDGSITGTIKQYNYPFELKLTRTPVLFKRPQTPQPPFPYLSEEVTFKNPESGITLAGTLTLPDTSGKYPAVIIISGSGPENRDGEQFEHKTFLVIADYLARHGIATLRYDDRGTGQSEGDYFTSSIPEFTTDAEAAIAYLQTRPEILPDQIGAIGHSEGGFVAFSVAAHHKTAFIITLAGGGINGRELLLMQRAAMLKASGASEEFIRQYNEYMRQAQEIALQSGNAQVCEQKLTGLFSGTPLTNEAQAVTQQLYNTGTLGLLSYDPEDDYPEITCPVLALNGEKDVQVPVANLSLIQKGLEENGNTQVTTIAYPNLNHIFQTAQTGLLVEYPDIEETVSPQVLKDITQWIKARQNK